MIQARPCNLAANYLAARGGEPFHQILDHALNCPVCQSFLDTHEKEFSAALETDSLGPLTGLAAEANQRLRGSLGNIQQPSVEPWKVPEIPGFRLAEPIVRSQSCQVYIATQLSLDRRVVLKIILAPRHHSNSAQLLAEAKTLATLKSPFILTIHETGTWKDCVWLALEYCQRGSVADALEAGRTWSEQQAAQIMEMVALGAHAAHKAGLVHRDIKPGNILFGPGNQPKLADFGFAQDSRVPKKRGHFGMVVGTPAYMAPEQVTGDRVDRRADVHALGAVLYHLLTGHAPFRAENDYEAMLLAAHLVPVHPHLINPSLSHDLGEICMKCLAKDPDLRFQSARELAADLRRFLNGEPVQARPLNRREKTARWIQKNPLLTAALGTLALLLLVTAAGFAALSVWALAERKVARHHEGEAREHERLADLRAYASGIQRANFEWDNRFCTHVVPLLESSPFHLRHWEHEFLTWKTRQSQVVLGTSQPPFLGLAVAPGGNQVITFGEGGTLRPWNLLTGKPGEPLLPSHHPILSLAYSGDGGRLAVLQDSGTVRIQDTRSGTWGLPIHLPAFKPHKVNRFGQLIALNRDGSRLVCPDGPNRLAVWDTNLGTRLRSMEAAHADVIRTVAMAPVGSVVASGGGDSAIFLWDMETGKKIRSFNRHTHTVRCLTFSPDGKRLYSAGNDSVAHGWEVENGKLIMHIRGAYGLVSTIATSADGKTLALGNESSIIHVIDAFTGAPLRTIIGHGNLVRAVGFTPEGNRLVSASWDGTLRVWNLRENQDVLRLNTKESARCIAFSPDGTLLASGGNDHLIHLWSLPGGQEVKTLEGHTKNVLSLCFHPDGQTIASAAEENRVGLWDLKTQERIRWLKGPGGPVHRICYSPDGTRLYGIGANGTALEWDLQTGALTRKVPAHQSPALGLAVSADGARVATSGEDGLIQIWDTADWSNPVILRGHDKPVCSLAFRPDNQRLVSGDSLGRIFEWDLSTGQSLQLPVAHTSEVTGLQYTPDSQRLVSCSLDKTLALWAPADGQLLLTMPRTFAPVRAVQISADGNQIASAGDDGFVAVRSPECRCETMRVFPGPGGVAAAGFSERGSEMLIRARSGTITAWDPRTGKELPPVSTVLPSTDPTLFSPVSPDGKWTVQVRDGTVEVIDNHLRALREERDARLLKAWAETGGAKD
jgi:WD40 repeat protein